MNLAALLKAAVLGIVEGATEFIPVSSTGHLIIAQNWLNFTGKVENAFIIFIQLGAILAVVWLYRRRFTDIVLNWRHVPEARRLVANLVVGMIPAVVIGLPTESWIETHLFKPLPVALALGIGGLAIVVIEKRYRQPSIAEVDQLGVKKAFGVGIIQVLAILFPGVSRSGATIMGGMVLGLSRKAATEFSFFLAVPAMLGATGIKMLHIYPLITPADLPVFALGFGVSFLVSLAAIRGLLAFISRNTFVPFAWYRIAFGLAVGLLYWERTTGF